MPHTFPRLIGKLAAANEAVQEGLRFRDLCAYGF